MQRDSDKISLHDSVMEFLFHQFFRTLHQYFGGDAVFLHNLVDALEDEDGLVVVGLHRLVDDLGQLGKIANKEPGIHANAVAADAGAWLQDVYAWMHIADSDNLIHIHVVVTTYTAEFVCKGYINSAEGIFNHLGHLGSTNICDDDLTLTEGRIIALLTFSPISRLSAAIVRLL